MSEIERLLPKIEDENPIVECPMECAEKYREKVIAALKGKIWVRVGVDELLGVLAQAYCTPENRHKELDANLITAMAKNIIKFLDEKSEVKG